MISGNNFTMADIESRMENSNGDWQHFAGTEWSILVDEIETLSIALNINSGELEEDFTWEAVGIRAMINHAFNPEQLNLVISSDEQNSQEQLKELLDYFLRNDINTPIEVVEILEMRRYLWGRLLGTLSENQAQGLFGELYFMNEWLSDPLQENIAHWSGPDGALNDFNWNDLEFHIEVKTSSLLSPPLQHEISSMHQLNPDDGHTLLLFSMSARIDEGGAHSLNTLIEEIREALLEQNQFAALTEFDEKLVDYGWNPNQGDFRFIVDDDLANLYHIRNDFPRITSEELEDILDERVNIGSYRIILSNVQHLLLNVENGSSANQLLQAALNQD
tara:strand:+ start:480 stop:1478 length:999 start_codon:yes stop_codon:yes gene_type:complete